MRAVSSDEVAFVSIHLTWRYISPQVSSTTMDVGLPETIPGSVVDGEIDFTLVVVWSFCITLLLFRTI